MVNLKILSSRLAQIEKHWQKIEACNPCTYDAFLKDESLQDIVEYNLFQIINHLISLIQHIVVDEGFGFPETAYEAAEILQEKKIFVEQDLALLRKMIGFRNIIGHDYVNLNKEVVYAVLDRGKKDVGRIITKLTANFL